MILLAILSVAQLSAQSLDSLFKGVKYRHIGPFRGGRSVTAMGVVDDPLTYYMGNTGGGIWKTTDAGQRWENISDGYFGTSSVGAIAVSESDPNIVYVGMGEHAPRGVMTSYGDGVYKSYDAGKTWEKLGLSETQHIARIVIHPKNPNIVYVAAQGALHGDNPDRGIYKSTDGGTTWQKVLYVNEKTGCSELSMDYHNPMVLYATMWEHQRLPWKVISGGSGSGVYKSTDAGATWRKIHNGLPKEKGKMAIAVSRANSDKVYALIESDSDKDQGGLFVSNNGGDSWSLVSGDNRLTQRAWYYIEVFADPNDENTVYVLSASAHRSIDGGKTWETISGTHGDYHDLWINPKDSKNMVIANDGGAAISFNQGASWSTQSNMSTAQIYRVSVDNLFPYNLYGGQQDNTSVRIASMSQGRWSIGFQDWTYSAGGESAFLAFDPDDPRYVLGGSYLGYIQMLDQESKQSTNINASPIQYLGRAASDMKYRFNWNAPIIRSMHEENTFYHAAQVLLRTRDMGRTWEEASPDLTKNEKERQVKGGGPYTVEAVGAENYGTIAYVIESPHEAGVIYVGTDDGLVQLTRDNGKTWTNVTPKGLQDCLVNSVDVSPHDPGTVYIATTRYKFNDKTPAIYKSTNYGRSWTNISQGIPYGAFTRVVREDEKRKDLLYAGTETGMYISWNGGKLWEKFQLNLPNTPITDVLQKHDDLIIATMGRGFWILDDVGLLRQKESATPSAVLYKPEDAYYGQWGSPLNSNSESFKGYGLFEGINPANGVVFYYRLPELKDADEITLKISDTEGNVVNTYSSKKDPDFVQYAGGPSPVPILAKSKGLNRFVWNTRYPTATGVPSVYIEGSFSGHKANPGNYQAVLTIGGEEFSTDFSILKNPTFEVSDADYREYHEFMSEVESTLNDMHEMVNSVLSSRIQLEAVVADLKEEDSMKGLVTEAEAIITKMKTWDEEMVQRKSKAYDDVENFPNKFTAEYMMMINATESSIPRVNQPNKERRQELDTQWAGLKRRGAEILNNDIPAINKKLWDAGVGAVRLK